MVRNVVGWQVVPYAGAPEIGNDRQWTFLVRRKDGVSVRDECRKLSPSLCRVATLVTRRRLTLIRTSVKSQDGNFEKDSLGNY